MAQSSVHLPFLSSPGQRVLNCQRKVQRTSPQAHGSNTPNATGFICVLPSWDHLQFPGQSSYFPFFFMLAGNVCKDASEARLCSFCLFKALFNPFLRGLGEITSSGLAFPKEGNERFALAGREAWRSLRSRRS